MSDLQLGPATPSPHPGVCRLVMPEGGDARVVDAALRLGSTGGPHVVLLADPSAVARRARTLGVEVDIDVTAPDAALTVDLVGAYANERRLAPAVARRLLRRPEMLGAALVRAGRADGLVAGATSPTRDVLMACGTLFGLADGCRTPSSSFLLETSDGRRLVLADCAVNPDPSAAELADIAIQSAATARRLLADEPRVAMLSFATEGSAEHPRVDKVRRATAIVRAIAPDLLVAGEIQADAAVDVDVARHKLEVLGDVAGRANVLVFPDLDAGNIAYKLVRALGHARAVGVFLQGYRFPAVDLSRGATVDEIVEAVGALSVLASGRLAPALG